MLQSATLHTILLNESQRGEREKEEERRKTKNNKNKNKIEDQNKK